MLQERLESEIQSGRRVCLMPTGTSVMEQLIYTLVVDQEILINIEWYACAAEEHMHTHVQKTAELWFRGGLSVW